MPSALPDGEPVPEDGSLPATALGQVGSAPFGFYVHVPFCRVRCGYCDFTTYTAAELGGASSGAVSRASYAAVACDEVRLARKVLGDREVPVSTVFFGGGTPTLLPAADLLRLLDEVRAEFGLTADAEVTVEANPDSVSLEQLGELRAGGVTRISFGMQSAVPAVLRVLDRTHDPERVPEAVAEARAAGFRSVSLDLIYGTPGETADDWRATLAAAIALAPDHVSAYALVVEPGTALARRVVSGEVPLPDDDDLADKYELADDALASAGLGWYEVSNWARDEASRCRHNLGYWTGGHWWGVGPGAHSHVGGVRWWNVKHPAPYADRLGSGRTPAAGRERLDAEVRRVERVLLQVRLREGLPLELLDEAGRSRLDGLEREGLATVGGGRLVLTRRGRLLADAVVRSLLP